MLSACRHRCRSPEIGVSHSVIFVGLGSPGNRCAGYLLWRTPYGSPFYQRNKHWARGEEDRECWLVRADSPLRGEIEAVLAAHGGVPQGEAVALEQARK